MSLLIFSFFFFIIAVMVLSLACRGWAFKCIIPLNFVIFYLFAAKEVEVGSRYVMWMLHVLLLAYLYFSVKVTGSGRIKKYQTDLHINS